MLARELGQHRIVCILDQNMNYAAGDVYGTDLCRQLRSKRTFRAMFFRAANFSIAGSGFFEMSGCRPTVTVT